MAPQARIRTADRAIGFGRYARSGWIFTTWGLALRMGSFWGTFARMAQMLYGVEIQGSEPCHRILC